MPGVAQGAIQEGTYVAREIRRRLAGEPRSRSATPTRATSRSIGRLRGVANIRWLGPFGQLSGFLAWALWLGIHIFYLIGFSNRIVVTSAGRGGSSPTVAGRG